MATTEGSERGRAQRKRPAAKDALLFHLRQISRQGIDNWRRWRLFLAFECESTFLHSMPFCLSYHRSGHPLMRTSLLLAHIVPYRSNYVPMGAP